MITSIWDHVVDIAPYDRYKEATQKKLLLKWFWEDWMKTPRFVAWCHCTKNEVFHQGSLQKMGPNPQETADLVTFTEETFNEKLHFCSMCSCYRYCTTSLHDLVFLFFCFFLVLLHIPLWCFECKCIRQLDKI